MSTFVGFGFGPIQAGLFLSEAFDSGKFERLVVSEVNAALIEGLRAADGVYTVNVARADGLERRLIEGIEIYDPSDETDREALIRAIAEATELATALPSVSFYGPGSGNAASPASILADGLLRKISTCGPRAVLYAGENDLDAAAKLEQALIARGAPTDQLACLNTVIGKMSGVLTGRAALEREGSAPFVPGADRAFRVEAFNRIHIEKIPWPTFPRRLKAFVEHDDLRLFEEAKLFGHNAAHALLGYRLEATGHAWMCDARTQPALIEDVRGAFLEESGAALRRKFAGRDALFTSTGFRAYVDDLMMRMTNPFLHDAVARVTRDPARKLGWNDRLVGTIRLALEEGVEPRRFATGARLALERWSRETQSPIELAPATLWPEIDPEAARAMFGQIMK